MSAPDPSPETGSSFASSLATHLGAAVGIVVLAALGFWAIGDRGDDELVVADAPPATDEAPEEPVEPTDDEPEDLEPATSDEPTDDAPATDDQPAPEPEDDATDPADDDADTDEPADEGPDEEPEPEGPDEPEPTPSIPPSDITVQVLDGYQADGGAAADAVAAELAAAGYPIVAQNPALRYDVTTVLWTSGNEAAARQVAAAIGAAEVRAQPGSLSESVAVHVVVGADRG